jgi:hypothetical protein
MEDGRSRMELGKRESRSEPKNVRAYCIRRHQTSMKGSVRGWRMKIGWSPPLPLSLSGGRWSVVGGPVTHHASRITHHVSRRSFVKSK